VCEVAEGGDDGAHQLVATLGPLVTVHIGPHGDGRAGPLRRGQFAPQQLGRVHLDHDLAVEVVPGVEVEVRVRVAREAVVAHHSVGDEVAGAGRDVVHRQLEPEGGYRDHVEGYVGLHGG